MPSSKGKAGKVRAAPVRRRARAAPKPAATGTPLNAHFTLEELCFSSVAVRLGIDNTPDEEIVAHLRVLAQGLERVRALLGHPMHIDSGYRCGALNAAVKGSKTSAHTRGYAADFICAAYGEPLQIVQTVARSNIAFDQCIQEGTWVHISFDPRLRKEVLTAHFGPDGTRYTPGV